MGGHTFKNARLYRKEGELPFAANLTETAGLEFCDVVRQRGRRDLEGLIGVAATQRTTGLRNSFQKFESLGIGKRFKDGGALGAAEARWLRRLGGKRFLVCGHHLVSGS